jgi:hypothetical protein
LGAASFAVQHDSNFVAESERELGPELQGATSICCSLTLVFFSVSEPEPHHMNQLCNTDEMNKFDLSKTF